MDSYIVRVWSLAFRALRVVSPHEWAKRILPNALVKTWGFSDSWVVGWTIIAIVAVVSVPELMGMWVGGIALVLGALRVLEIVGYLLAVMLVTDAHWSSDKPAPELRSARRSLVLALHNYLEIVLWFAVFYSAVAGQFKGAAEALSTSIGAVYFSVVTMTTLGYGDVTPVKGGAQALVTIHTGLGLFMALIVLGWFVGLLPSRSAMER